jgi:hypothetical protein
MNKNTHTHILIYICIYILEDVPSSEASDALAVAGGGSNEGYGYNGAMVPIQEEEVSTLFVHIIIHICMCVYV